jgi:hypothetical protein
VSHVVVVAAVVFGDFDRGRQTGHFRPQVTYLGLPPLEITKKVMIVFVAFYPLAVWGDGCNRWKAILASGNPDVGKVACSDEI